MGVGAVAVGGGPTGRSAAHDDASDDDVTVGDAAVLPPLLPPTALFGRGDWRAAGEGELASLLGATAAASDPAAAAAAAAAAPSLSACFRSTLVW